MPVAGGPGPAADPSLSLRQALVPVPASCAGDLLGLRCAHPWAAFEGNVWPSLTLISCWFATVCWTFSFDTVYAMADRPDDARLGLRSSALP